jgi:hypothetical protein
MSDDVTDDVLRAWLSGLDDLFARVAGRFGRVEPRRQARLYLMGLQAPLERKNGWQLAEAAGDATPDRMQRLLNNARWDAREVRDDLRGYVTEQLGDPGGVLIVDETGFVKKGTRSAGVQRQYSGTAGRVENCQLGVFAAYASPRGRALIDAELYLPRSWTDDPARCAQAGIPGQVGFATKPALAMSMLGRALDAGVPARWVTVDEAYGQDHKFRRFCEQRRLSYVVAVPRSQSTGPGTGYGNTGSRADVLAAAAPAQAWKRLSAGDGAKGPRLYDSALATLPGEPGGGAERWLLIRRWRGPDGAQRLVAATADPATLPPKATWYLVTNLPRPGPRARPKARTQPPSWPRSCGSTASGHWTEQSYKQVEDQLGWADFQVRSDVAIRRHQALVNCAFSFC